MLELPTKNLNKGAGVLVDFLKLSHHATTSLIAKIMLSSGRELIDFVINKYSSYRHRILAEGGAEQKLRVKYESSVAANPNTLF